MRALKTVLLLGAIFASPLAASAEQGSTECVLFKKFPKDSVGDFYRRDSLPVHGTLPGDLPRRDPPSSSNFKIFGKDLSGSSDFRIYGDDLLPRNWRFSNPVLRRYPDGLAPGRHYSFDHKENIEFRPSLIDAEADVCIAYLNSDLKDGIQQLDRIVRKDSKASKNFYNRAAFKYLFKDYVGARADLNTCLKLWVKEYAFLESSEADFRSLAIEELDKKVCQALLNRKK